METPHRSDLIAEAKTLIADFRTYNFGLYNADRSAHVVAPDLVAALEAVSAERDEAVSLHNRAYRQRDDERAAKEGNVRALNTALTERDQALSVIAELQKGIQRFDAVAYYAEAREILSRIPEHPKED